MKKEKFTIGHGLLLAESAALMIALLMPITPSKTGSGRGLPHVFMPEPSYGEEVLLYFVLTNILLAILGGAFALWLWRNKASAKDKEVEERLGVKK